MNMNIRKVMVGLSLVALAASCTEPAPLPPKGQVAVQLDASAGGTRLTTHGADSLPPPPKGGPPRNVREEGWPCIGDGQSGKRVQMLYVHGPGVNNHASLVPTLESYARQIQGAFLLSAQETGGYRLLRYATDAACRLSIPNVEVSAGALTSFDQFITELQQQGYNRPDRKYSAWVDGANSYCGIGTLWYDERPGLDNYNEVSTSWARSDRGQNCWNYAELHEIMHGLGAVQENAVNSTRAAHCNDEYDVMCYPDGGERGTVRIACGDVNHDQLLDCNHDDYFTTAATPGSYLANNWNTANSDFLIREPAPQPTTTTTIAPPPTTSSTTTTTVVGSSGTDTTLKLAPTRARVNQSVTASVKVLGDCTPAGVVGFYSGKQLLIKENLDANSTATITLLFQTPGRYTITAKYEGTKECDRSSHSLRRVIAA